MVYVMTAVVVVVVVTGNAMVRGKKEPLHHPFAVVIVVIYESSALPNSSLMIGRVTVRTCISEQRQGRGKRQVRERGYGNRHS